MKFTKTQFFLLLDAIVAVEGLAIGEGTSVWFLNAY